MFGVGVFDACRRNKWLAQGQEASLSIGLRLREAYQLFTSEE